MTLRFVSCFLQSSDVSDWNFKDFGCLLVCLEKGGKFEFEIEIEFELNFCSTFVKLEGFWSI